jgi:hypothetical protein
LNETGKVLPWLNRPKVEDEAVLKAPHATKVVNFCRAGEGPKSRVDATVDATDPQWIDLQEPDNILPSGFRDRDNPVRCAGSEADRPL